MKVTNLLAASLGTRLAMASSLAGAPDAPRCQKPDEAFIRASKQLAFEALLQEGTSSGQYPYVSVHTLVHIYSQSKDQGAGSLTVCMLTGQIIPSAP